MSFALQTLRATRDEWLARINRLDAGISDITDRLDKLREDRAEAYEQADELQIAIEVIEGSRVEVVSNA